MSKIIIVIGQSASGKSSYVRKTFLNNDINLCMLQLEPIKHTIKDNICLLGDYVTSRRCAGTDTLPYNVIDKIITFVINNYKKFGIIVAEGDRINNRKFFDNIKRLNLNDIEVVLFNCSIITSMERLKKEGSLIGETFIKTTKTKSMNMFNYAKLLGFNIKEIYTDDSNKNILNI